MQPLARSRLIRILIHERGKKNKPENTIGSTHQAQGVSRPIGGLGCREDTAITEDEGIDIARPTRPSEIREGEIETAEKSEAALVLLNFLLFYLTDC